MRSLKHISQLSDDTNNLKMGTYPSHTNSLWDFLVNRNISNKLSHHFSFCFYVGAYDGWGDGGRWGGQRGGRSWRSHERRPASAGLPVGRVVVHQHFLHLSHPWGTRTRCQLNSDVSTLSVDSREKKMTINLKNNNEIVQHVLPCPGKSVMLLQWCSIFPLCRFSFPPLSISRGEVSWMFCPCCYKKNFFLKTGW